MWPQISILSYQEMDLVWSSAAVAHLLQGLTCFMFRDAPLNSIVVRRSYLGCCWFPISLSVFAHGTVAH